MTTKTTKPTKPTKPQLEGQISELVKRVLEANQRMDTAEKEARGSKFDAETATKRISCLQGQLDHVRHAVEAFAAAECPNLDLHPNAGAAMASFAQALTGVAPATTQAPGTRRDTMADVLEHLHKLVR